MKRLLLILAMGLLFNTAADAAATTLDGQAIFNRDCSVCHTMNPPPKSAPPILMVISRYHMKYQTKEEGLNHLVAYLKLPKKQNAIEQQAITQFGLMPPSPLSVPELRAVAGWLWDQNSPAMGGCRGFRGQGRMNKSCNQAIQ